MAGTRNGFEIRAELLRRDGKTISDLAVLAGVDRSLASRTVNGLANNRKVLRALLSLGVPKRLLALPEDMKGKEAA